MKSHLLVFLFSIIIPSEGVSFPMILPTILPSGSGLFLIDSFSLEEIFSHSILSSFDVKPTKLAYLYSESILNCFKSSLVIPEYLVSIFATFSFSSSPPSNQKEAQVLHPSIVTISTSDFFSLFF